MGFVEVLMATDLLTPGADVEVAVEKEARSVYGDDVVRCTESCTVKRVRIGN